MTYSLKIQMRYPDFDMQGVVNHAVIDTYIELGYINFIREHINTEWNFITLPYKVVNVKTRYQISITPEDKPVVIIAITKIANTYFEVAAQVADETNPKKIYAEGGRQIVYLPKNKVDRIDSDTIARLTRFRNF